MYVFIDNVAELKFQLHKGVVMVVW